MLFFLKQILSMSAHVSSRLIFFLSVVGIFLLVLSVVSNIFRPLSLVGKPHSHPPKGSSAYGSSESSCMLFSVSHTTASTSMVSSSLLDFSLSVSKNLSSCEEIAIQSLLGIDLFCVQLAKAR